MMSPGIVEIVEETNIGNLKKDVYVAVGRNDRCILKWALENVVSPRSRIFLVHVFPSITHVPRPVGMLSKIQVSEEQWMAHVNQEHNCRDNILQKYIRLCNDYKVVVDTVLIESSLTAKAILELMPVLNISKLVIGARRLKMGQQKRELIRKNAPEFCEIMIIRDGNNIANKQKIGFNSSSPIPIIRSTRTSTQGGSGRQLERTLFECTCFSGRFSES